MLSKDCDNTWHNATIWQSEKFNDFDSLTKGTPVHIIGRLRMQRYTGSDGDERTVYEVIVSSLEILDTNPVMES